MTNDYIKDYNNILMSYDSPCVDMTISSKFDREEKNEWNGALALGQALIKTVLNNQGKTG